MNDVQIIWDLPDDPDGNYVHIIEGHDVTVDEVEEVLRDPDAEDAISRASGNPAVFGWTSTGKYIIVIYELVMDDPYTVYRSRLTRFHRPDSVWQRKRIFHKIASRTSHCRRVGICSYMSNERTQKIVSCELIASVGGVHE